MSVVSVAASRSTPVLTLVANSVCVRLHFVRSTGNSPLVPARSNSVVGTYCKVASTSLGGTLGCTGSLAAGRTDCLPAPPVFLRPTFPFLLGAACWARPERHFDFYRETLLLAGYIVMSQRNG
jgi:hypothetical protein